MGGKAKALAALQGAKMPIPAWFVLSPDALNDSLNPSQRQSLGEGEVASIIANLQTSAAVQQELTEALTELFGQGTVFAVRSSASDEDGSYHSFAGQLESFLFVQAENVPQKVAEVWRSGFSDRILAYRRENNLGPPRPPAVLIQEMVNAEVSGVAFGADPVTGQRGVAVVTAVYGLGTSLVSGECDADTFHVNRQGKIIKRQIADKKLAHVCENGEVTAREVPESQGKEPALTDTQIQEIALLVRRVGKHFGRPQDIEWAIAEGHLYLLQSRPITGLTQLADPDGVLNLWDNSNIVESYGGVTTPLTFSFASRVYAEVYRQFCRLMGVPAGAIAANSRVFAQMLGLIRGRVYYNLLSWYRVLALLPGFTVNRQFMEQMMGVKEGLPAEILTELSQKNWGDRLSDGIRLFSTVVGLVANLIMLPRQIKSFYLRLDKALSPMDLEELRADELAAYYYDLERQLLTRWDAPLVNDFFAMIFYGVLRKLTVKWCDDPKETLQNDLIGGEGGMISAEPAKRVKEMAKIAAEKPAFVERLCDGDLHSILSAIEQFPQFQEQYQAYLDKFGDRCLGELKLESFTLHDDPLPLLHSVGQLATSTEKLNATSMEPALRSQAEARVKETLSSQPWKHMLFNWVLENARQRVRDRENLRFERTRLFGRVRRIFLEIGQRFHSLDILAHPRDIFYLEVPEIIGFIQGTATCTNLKGLVALKQAEFASYRQGEQPGDRFETRGIVHQGNSFQSPAAAQILDPTLAYLQGIGCCPGLVKARVRVIKDPVGVTLEKGFILVAERTDPGWIMLFPAASGLLVERGSLLSHSAIVAREMGIPAIVSIAGVTNWLKDGDWVEMDGSTGIVRRL